MSSLAEMPPSLPTKSRWPVDEKETTCRSPWRARLRSDTGIASLLISAISCQEAPLSCERKGPERQPRATTDALTGETAMQLLYPPWLPADWGRFKCFTLLVTGGLSAAVQFCPPSVEDNRANM